MVEGQNVELAQADVEITTEDIPGWLVATMDHLTVALDITLSPGLIEEGIARELVNRIQNIRKNKDFEVTDKIDLIIESHPEIISAITHFNFYFALNPRRQLQLLIIDNDGKTGGTRRQFIYLYKVSKMYETSLTL